MPFVLDNRKLSEQLTYDFVEGEACRCNRKETGLRKAQPRMSLHRAIQRQRDYLLALSMILSIMQSSAPFVSYSYTRPSSTMLAAAGSSGSVATAGIL